MKGIKKVWSECDVSSNLSFSDKYCRIKSTIFSSELQLIMNIKLHKIEFLLM